MAPSVRGRERIAVVGLLLVSGLATGALAGFAVGSLWRALSLPKASTAVAALVIAGGVALDLLAPRVRWLKPLAVGTQVPIEWGRIFSPKVAAVLYGARLGVGPLTILTTWGWWTSVLVGATHGPWWGALVGATFHLVRVVTMLAVVSGATSMADRMANVQRRGSIVRWITMAATLAAVAAGLVIWAADGDDTTSTTTTVVPATVATTTTAGLPEGLADLPVDTTPVEFEVPMEQLLLTEAEVAAYVPGFAEAPAGEFAGTGALDLDAAAAAEVDTAAERALLETRGFAGGYARALRNVAGDVVFLTAYQFGDPTQAAAYLIDGSDTLLSRGAAPYDVPGMPAAFGFSQTDETEAGAFVAHGVAFTLGAHHFVVVVGGQGGGRSTEEAAVLARALETKARGLATA